MKTYKKLNYLFVTAMLVMFFCNQSCEKSTEFTTELAMDNDTIAMPKVSKTTRARVYSNTNWKAVLENSEADWISLTDENLKEVSLSGNDYIIINTTTNETGAVRKETIIVSTKNKTHRLTIKQSAY